MSASLRQVAAFEAVARTLHFGRAADELYVSQPMVSQEIRRLEGRVGTPLFARSTRRVELTLAGEALVPAARALLDASREFDISVHLAGRIDSATLRLAASPSAMNGLVPQVLRRAEQELSTLTIEDVAVDTGEVGSTLVAGGADIGIGRFLELPASFRVERLREDTVVVAVSADHVAASMDTVDLAALQDLPLLLWPRERSPRYYDALLAICHDRGMDPVVLVSQPRIIGTRSYFLSEGRAFSLIPELTVPALPAGIIARPLQRAARLPLEVGWRRLDDRVEVRRLLDLIRATTDPARRAKRGTAA